MLENSIGTLSQMGKPPDGAIYMQLLLHNKRHTQNQEENNTDLESTSQDLSNDMLNMVSAPIFAQNLLLQRLTLRVAGRPPTERAGPRPTLPPPRTCYWDSVAVCGGLNHRGPLWQPRHHCLETAASMPWYLHQHRTPRPWCRGCGIY